jgi:hypothetical protein
LIRSNLDLLRQIVKRSCLELFWSLTLRMLCVSLTVARLIHQPWTWGRREEKVAEGCLLGLKLSVLLPQERPMYLKTHAMMSLLVVLFQCKTWSWHDT